MPLVLPPLSLYIHIPWCVKKCPYCDFNSHENSQQKSPPEAEYLNALKQDLIQDKHWAQGRKLRSIFFGGGTPSLVAAKTIGGILEYAEQVIGFEPDIEITLEANPGTFEQEKFSDYRQAGINRLSIGVQSFQEKHLNKLGRIHSSQEATKAISAAKKVGFDNINIDLMHGLPEQSVDEALDDLKTAIALEPTHLSWYQLTIEPNTVFYRQPPPLPADDTLADIQDAGLQLLAQHGYKQYEVSAFCRDQTVSQHNVNYWSFGDYIGIGAGAHGKVTDLKKQAIIRRQKTRLPEHYLNSEGAPSFKETLVDNTELPLEFLMNALRLNDGVPSEYFIERTGLSLTVINKPLNELIQKGLLEYTDNKLKASDLGQRFLNTILSTFIDHQSDCI
ncbi:MAG: radical SAM family heme chaperone HemW [Cellvibrionaceae bacterium]